MVRTTTPAGTGISGTGRGPGGCPEFRNGVRPGETRFVSDPAKGGGTARPEPGRPLAAPAPGRPEAARPFTPEQQRRNHELLVLAPSLP
ncbi:hypothetical protein [Streptomyces sp. NPDC050856]|uniref:hypothetical protein n=1 Tax=Streptomyces sp. NPDC050856 TaxID=3154939 RepID=UPI00340D1B06